MDFLEKSESNNLTYQAFLYDLGFYRPLEILELRCIAFYPYTNTPHSSQSRVITWLTYDETSADNATTARLACSPRERCERRQATPLNFQGREC